MAMREVIMHGGKRLVVRLLTLAMLALALPALAGCWPGTQQQASTAPPATISATAPAGAATTPPPVATWTAGNPPPAPKSAPKPKPAPAPQETVTRQSASAAILKAVNSSGSMGSNPDARFTAIHIKVFEQSSSGTLWVGATMDNNLDGGIVFAKKTPGHSWVIVDTGTGIDGSELAGKAPAAIAAKFEAAFPQ